MPEVNLKLLFGLMVGVALATGTVFAVHYVQNPRIAAALERQADLAMKEAEAAERDKKPALKYKCEERAERFLTRYLEFKPRDYEKKTRLALLLTGETFEGRIKQRRRAIGLLEDVLEHQESPAARPDLRRLLVKVALEIGAVKSARDHLKILWGGDEHARHDQVAAYNLPPTERGQLELYWGMLLEFNESQRPEAIAFYRHAVDDADCDLRLVSPREGKTGVPTEGRNLLVVALGDQGLHLRRFGADGRMLDADETQLKDKAVEVGRLRDLVQPLVPPHELSRAEKLHVLVAANAVLGLTPEAGPEGEAQSRYVRLAYLLRQIRVDDPKERRPREQEADALVDCLVDKNKDSALAWLARWRYRLNFDLVAGRDEKDPARVPLAVAGEDVFEAHKLKPKLPEVLLACAEKERMLGERAEAIKYLNLGLEELSSQGRRDAFQFQFLYHLTNVHLDEAFDPQTAEPARQRAIAEARRVLGEARKTRISPMACVFLEARLAYQEGNYALAVELFKQALPELERQTDLAITINLYLGQAYERLASPAESLAAFERVLLLQPRNVPANLGVAWALLQQGKLEEAKRRFGQVARGDKLPARIVLDMARVELELQLLRDPAQRSWAECDAALAAAANVPAITAEVAILRAERCVGAGQGDLLETLLGLMKASNVLRRELAANDARQWARTQGSLAAFLFGASDSPDRAPLLVSAQVDLLLRAGDPDAALGLLDAARAQRGERVEYRLSLARIALARPAAGADQAKAELARAEQGWEGLGADERAQLLYGLAEMQIRSSHITEARRFIELLARQERYQNDLKLRLLLFDLATQANDGRGDVEGMNQALADIQAIERGQGEYSRYGRAVLLIWHARKQQADKGPLPAPLLTEAAFLLDQVATARPTWAPVYLARAQLAELTGDKSRAITAYKLAWQNGEQNPEVVTRLVVLLEEANRKEEAAQIVEQVRASLLVNSELGLLATDLRLKLDDPATRIANLRKSVAADSRDVRLLLKQAFRFEGQAQTAEARGNLERAVRVEPQNPDAWIALVAFLHRQGEDGAARDQLARAQAAVPPQRWAITRALCLDALGDKERTDAFAQALRERPHDRLVVRLTAEFQLRSGRLKEAEALLRQFDADKEMEAREDDRRWARHALALLLASGNDFERFREALALVGLSLDASGKLLPESDPLPPGTELRRTRARVLACQPQKQFRERAIALLEAMYALRELNEEDRLVLAQLYEQNGAPEKALPQYAQSSTPPSLVAYIRGLLRARNFPEAEKQIAQLKNLEKLNRQPEGAFGSVDLEALLLEARDGDKGKEAAIALLERRRDATTPPRPETTLAVVAALARQGKHERCYKEVLAAWDTRGLPPESLGGPSVAVLRGMKADEKQIAAIEERLKQAVAADPKKMVLRMHLADLYDIAGRYDRAIEEYREILRPENEPNNLVARNNLAWLLAEYKNQGDEALREVDKAIAGVGRRPDLLDTRGIIQLKRGETREALTDLKEAAEDQRTAVRLFHLARAYDKAGDRAAAAGILKEACTQSKLTIAQLHPTEREVCMKLLADYQLKEYSSR